MRLFKKNKKLLELKNKNLTEIAKTLAEEKIITVPKDNNHNTFGDRIDVLDSDGNLPWGWIAHHKDLVNDIESRHKHFMNLWLDSRSGNQQQQYENLKSFITFLEDAKQISYEKGECYFKWFQDIIADDNYINQRIQELNQLTKDTKDRQPTPEPPVN